MIYKFFIVVIFIQFLQSEFIPFGGELYFDSNNAQNMGMGGYNASFSTGANPAKLILTDHPSFSLSYKNKYMGLANVTIASILFNHRISEKKVPIFLTLINRSVNNIPDTRLIKNNDGSIDYQKISYFSQNETGFALTTSYPFKNIILGLTIKPYYTKILDNKAFGIASDLGVQKNYINKKVEIGLKVENFFSANYWDTGRLENNFPYLMTNMQINLASLLIGFEFGSYLDSYNKINYHFGSEYIHNKILFLRCGLSDDFFSSGIGIKINSFKIDYALLSSIRVNPFLNSHIISLVINFDDIISLKSKISP